MNKEWTTKEEGYLYSYSEYVWTTNQNCIKGCVVFLSLFFYLTTLRAVFLYSDKILIFLSQKQLHRHPVIKLSGLYGFFCFHAQIHIGKDLFPGK